MNTQHALLRRVSIGTLAELLGVSVGTIRCWEQNDRLPDGIKTARTRGGHRRFDLTEFVRGDEQKRDI